MIKHLLTTILTALLLTSCTGGSSDAQTTDTTTDKTPPAGSWLEAVNLPAGVIRIKERSRDVKDNKDYYCNYTIDELGRLVERERTSLLGTDKLTYYYTGDAMVPDSAVQISPDGKRSSEAYTSDSRWSVRVSYDFYPLMRRCNPEQTEDLGEGVKVEIEHGDDGDVTSKEVSVNGDLYSAEIYLRGKYDELVAATVYLMPYDMDQAVFDYIHGDDGYWITRIMHIFPDKHKTDGRMYTKMVTTRTLYYK